MIGLGSVRALPEQHVTIAPEDHEALRKLICAFGEIETPADCGLALQMRLFSQSILARLPTVPADRVLVQEALTLEAPDPAGPGEMLYISGSVRQDALSCLFELEAKRHQTSDRNAARLVAQLKLAEAKVLDSPPIHGAARVEGPGLNVLIEASHVAAYAEISGDVNPIHIDLALVRSLGLRERIVHGSLLASLIEPALRTAGFDRQTQKLRMRFMAPAFAGEPLHLTIAGGNPDRARILASGPDKGIRFMADASFAQ